MNQLTMQRLQRSTGHASVSVAMTNGRTMLRRNRDSGCAKIRFPRVSGGGPLDAVLINTAGGITGGDMLRWEVHAGPHSRFQLTTQASEKIYKSTGVHAVIDVAMELGESASLTWLPLETILFDKSRLRRRIDVNMAQNARLLMCETTVFGRQGHGEKITDAEFSDNWRITRDNRLIHAEAMTMSGDLGNILKLAACGNGAACVATVLLIGDDPEAHVENCRRIATDFPSVKAGISAWPAIDGTGKLLARLVAGDGQSLKKPLLKILELLNREAPLPTNWAA